MVNHIKKIAGLLSLAMVLVLAGCSGLINGSISSDDSIKKGTIGVSLNEISSRAAIAPTTLKVDGTEINHYLVTGTSKTGLSFTSEDLTPAAVKAGTAKMADVPYDDWTFTMTAYGDATTDKPLLRGTSVCNMKSAGETTVSFTLSSYDIDTLGSYSIIIKYTGSAWKANTYSFDWGLYDPITGNVLTATGASSDAAAATSVGSDAADAIHTADDYYVANTTNVNPGSYVFAVRVWNGSTQLAYASTGLVIEPGRVTSGTLELDDDIIQSLPLAPSGLFAQRLDDSIDGDYYDVRFAWTDNSNNEEGFELVLRTFTTTSEDWATFPEDATITNTTVMKLYDWGSILTLTNSTDTVKYVSGSLFSGSQELVLRLRTGVMYDAQIRAVNGIGKSATVARVADSASSASLEKDSAITAPTSTKTLLDDFDGKKVTGYDIGAAGANVHISLVKITYYLDGGTLSLAGTAQSSKKTYISYTPYTLKTNGSTDADKFIPLLEITDSDTATASDNTLLRNGTDWSKWVLSSDATSLSPTAQTYNTAFFANFQVIAIYGTTSGDITINSATITALAHESFKDDNLTAYYGTEATTPMATNSCKNGTITIPFGSPAQYVTVTVATDPLFDGGYYVLYVGEYPIEQKAYSTSSLNFSNFSTDRLASGSSTCIRVDAFTAGGEYASASFYITKGN